MTSRRAALNTGFEYRERVGAEAAGKTVLTHLSGRYRHSTEATWRKRIAAGEVRLDGTEARTTDVLRADALAVLEARVQGRASVRHATYTVFTAAGPRSSSS